jgi:quercetin 2,3-dioxygenase
MTEQTRTQHERAAVASVTDRQVLGPDQQVDRKAVVVEPGRWHDHDPFLLMFEDWFSSVGFEWHPHRGIETVTVVLDGELEHRDNRGGQGVLGAGDVQWMTAGSGLVHTELAHRRAGVHSLQLWVNLPSASKMVEPRYQDLRGDAVPVRTAPGVRAKVFSGRSGEVEGPALNHHPVTMVEVEMEPGARFVQELVASDRAFAYVLDGGADFGAGGGTAEAGQVVWFEPSPDVDHLAVEAGEHGTRFLVWAAAPLREPVVAYGPFVMNTRDQIVDAYEDYQAGRFGPIPA